MSWNKIEIWLKGVRQKLVLYTAGLFAARLFVFSAGLLAFAVLLDIVTPIPFVVRDKIVYSWLIFAVVLVIYGIFILRRITVWFVVERLSRECLECKDDLINAYSLNAKDPHLKTHSLEIEEKFYECVSEKLGLINIDAILPLKELKKIVISGVSLVLIFCLVIVIPQTKVKRSLWRILLPRQTAELEQFVSVKTGDIKLRWGQPATLRFEILKNLPAPLVAEVRRSKGRWQSLPPVFADDKQVVCTIPAVTETYQYRAAMQDLFSAIYKIEPVSIPQIVKQKIHYFYPAYSGLAESVEENALELRALKGTKVVMSFWFNKPISKLNITSSKGVDVAVGKSSESSLETKWGYQGEFVISAEDELKLEAVDNESISTGEPVIIPVHVQNDLPPLITLLSPQGDVVAGLYETLSLNMEASDDLGLHKIELAYRLRGDRDYKTVIIKKYSGTVEHDICEYQWKLGEFSFKPLDVIEYFLKAYDTNALEGYQSQSTPVQLIEIADFKKEHERIKDDLASFRNSLLNVLKQQASVRSGVEKLDPNLTDAQLEEYLNMQKDVNNDIKRQADKLSQLVERLNDDPLSSMQVQKEHAVMRDNLKALEQTQGQSALNSMSKKEFSSAVESQKRIEQELEKMALLSEDVMQYQNMQQLLDDSQKMQQSADDLLQKLQQLNNLQDPETQKQLNAILSQVNDLLKQVYDQMKLLPKELPEEFINQQAMKQMDFGKVTNSIDALNKALASGNLSQAIEQAKQLLSQMQKMLSEMNEASNSAGGGSSGTDELTQNIGKNAAELEKIIIEESEVQSTLKVFNQKKLNELYKKQEEMLKKLAERQKKVMDTSKKLRVNLSGQPALQIVAAYLDMAYIDMEKVLKELISLRVEKAPRYLGDIIDRIDFVKRQFEKDEVKDNGEMADFILAEEKDILNELKDKKDEESAEFDKKDSDTIKKYSEIQKKLQGRASSLGGELQKLSRSTAQLLPEMFDNLSDASSHLGNSSDALEKSMTRKAESESDQALEALSKSKESLNESLKRLSEMKSGAGGGKGQVFLRQGSGGNKGLSEGDVRIPGKDDYVPPKEFREEILKSIKENFPDTYRQIIEKYYKRLSE